MKNDLYPNTAEILQKIKKYCAYQERCHAEVKEKLYSYGLYKSNVETLLAQLIEENYLNEERFAILYAGGKFRIKQWGKIKIAYSLKQKKISAYCIKTALKNIPDHDYNITLTKIATAKWITLRKEKNTYSRIAKTTQFLMSRGFESDLIKEVIVTIRATE